MLELRKAGWRGSGKGRYVVNVEQWVSAILTSCKQYFLVLFRGLCGNNAILTCAVFFFFFFFWLVDRRTRVLSRAVVGTLGCHFCSTVETLGVACHCFASLVRFAGACCTCSFSYIITGVHLQRRSICCDLFMFKTVYSYS